MPNPTAHPVEPLLHQAAALEPALGTVAALDGESWLQEFASGAAVMMEWLDGPPRLVLTAPIGQPDPAAETAALNTALAYNGLWRDTGSLRIARDGDDGELMLLADLAEADLTPEHLAAELMRLEGVRQLWALLLQGLSTARGTRPPEADALGLRV